MPDDHLPAGFAPGSVFRCAMPVRWGDLDALNHVNNTLYFRYFEEARIRLFAKAGLDPSRGREGVLAHASCDFLKPLRYPATAVVTLALVRVGRSSLELDVALEVEEEPGVAYAKGRNVMVLTDARTGKSSPWTEDDLARLAVCFGSHFFKLNQGLE